MPLLQRPLRLIFAAMLLFGRHSAVAAVNPDWTTPQKPFRIAGNLYYVGSRDLAAYLVTTPEGNILINSNLQSSPPQIRAAVEQLGFHWSDTRILLNSQAHFDHVAGMAAIARQTRAKVMVMEGDAAVVETGAAHDFDPTLPRFAAAHVDHVLHDGEAVNLGGTTLVAHKTAGHTRGCTTWTMDVHEGQRTLHVVIPGGWSALDTYRLIDTPGHPASYPGMADDFAHTFNVLHALPCDIFLGAHGLYFDMQAKLARLPMEGPSVWIDPAGYQKAVTAAEKAFQARLQSERATSTHPR